MSIYGRIVFFYLWRRLLSHNFPEPLKTNEDYII
jgi:hypothetical protein